MAYIDTLGLFVKKCSYSSSLMAAVAYGKMAMKPNVVFLHQMQDDSDTVYDKAIKLAPMALAFVKEPPLYIMTFGLSPENVEAANEKLDAGGVEVELLTVLAENMPHHDFKPAEIRVLGEYFDAVGEEDFIFHVSDCIRKQGDEYRPEQDEEVIAAIANTTFANDGEDKYDE